MTVNHSSDLLSTVALGEDTQASTRTIPEIGNFRDNESGGKTNLDCTLMKKGW
jgi:hypothetical protein